MRKINYFIILLSGLVTAQTTFTLVKDIYPGAVGSSPSNLTIYNDKLYFSASSLVDGASIGNELWESDGTEAGTKLVADIIPGNSSSSPAALFVFNNKIYFSGSNVVNGSNVSGLLLSYDETTGVQTVSTVPKYSTSFTKVGDRLYFKSTNTSVTPNTQRLYFIEGGAQPVIADDNLNVNTIGFVGNKVIANAQFANASSPFLTQLFGFDGSTSNLIKAINPSTSSYPQYFTYSAALGKTFFNANGGNGAEPWMTDGTEAGTTIVKDINVSSGTSGSGPINFTEYNGKVYFSASDGITSGSELWVTDGTEQGTKMLKDIAPGTAGSFPEKMVVYKDKLYFFATNASNVKQLWETDGTEDGTKALASVASVSSFVTYNDKLYFSGRIGSTDTIGVELYQVNLPTGTLSISESNAKTLVYPNPTTGNVFVSNISEGNFELFDLSGKLVQSGIFNNNKIVIDRTSGTYILKVRSAGGKQAKLVTKLIIK
ncbi:ELWxxDGT repeat protein [Epilithonimonas hungarica]|uniref:ELWxxDGT repeat protein n=1 Tax=Epilithonimonas hungarica TaxID=454006 RepID=UPI002789DC27|nr:ELWxxDGT repeat protein [Epilithonimonas hungarica]MDP9955454.1 ELWxxDGT repeat protein [Epilithonimonas hungarica]